MAGGDAFELISLSQPKTLYQGFASKTSLASTSATTKNPLAAAITLPSLMDNDEGIVSATPSSLELAVYCLPQWIARTPSSSVSARAKDYARLITADLMKTSSFASLSTSAVSLIPTCESRVLSQIIACSFECGLEWIVSQARGLASVNPSLERQVEETRESVVLYDRLFEAGLLTDEQAYELPERNRRAMVLYLYFLVFGSPVGLSSQEDDSISSSINSIYRLKTEGISQPMQCLIVEVEDRSPFLLIGPEEIPKHDSMVLPIALGNITCASLPRLWCLQADRESKSKKWEIVSRCHLLSFNRVEHTLVAAGQALETKEIEIKLG